MKPSGPVKPSGPRSTAFRGSLSASSTFSSARVRVCACTATMRLLVYDNFMTNLKKNAELKCVKAELIRKAVRTHDRSFLLIESSMGFPYLIDVADVDYPGRWVSEERCAVRGELWECSEEALRSLDFLNGVPSVHMRKLVALQGEQEPAFVYVLKEANTIRAVCADRRKYLSVQPLGDWRAYLPASSETALAAAHAALPQTRISTLLPGPHAVFSYGSNGLQQMRQRLKNPALQFKPAILPNSLRIFCGASKSWEGGGVASIVPMPGWEVKGNLAYLSDDELRLLDRFEGTLRDEPYAATTRGYRRQDVHVLCEVDQQIQTVEAIVYIKNDPRWTRAPSDAYLAACQKNIDIFWPMERVEVRDSRGLLRGGIGTPLHSAASPSLRMSRAKSPAPDAIMSNPLLLLQQMQRDGPLSHDETHPPPKRRKKAPMLAAAEALTAATAAAITSVTHVAACAGSTNAVAAASTTVMSVNEALSNASASAVASTSDSTMPEAPPVVTAAEAAAVAALDDTAAAAHAASRSLAAAAATLCVTSVADGAPVAGDSVPIVIQSAEKINVTTSMDGGDAVLTSPASTAQLTAATGCTAAQLNAVIVAAAATETAAAAAAGAMDAVQKAQAAEEVANMANRVATAKAALAITAAAVAQQKVAEAQAAAKRAKDKVQDLAVQCKPEPSHS